MISNQILSTTIEGIKNISKVDFCVADTEGKTLASTFDCGNTYEEAIMAFVDSPAESQVLQGCQFFKVYDENQLEYVILAKGENDDVYMIGKIASFQIQNLLVAYKERYDKDNFIKNLLFILKTSVFSFVCYYHFRIVIFYSFDRSCSFLVF